ncbi:hypothetical protein VARIO8X_40007 [Burkholderiales bacterium 8X]|nr:hypothetical protein VARIO8X_40007 [Burkholderiales bacterium 8X]
MPRGASLLVAAVLRRRQLGRAGLLHVELPADHPHLAELLGRAGLRAPAALRHGGGCRHFPYGHLPAGPRPRALEGRVRAAEPPPQGRPIRREPQSAAALLPIPGGAQAGAEQHPGALPRIARRARLRP